MNHLSVFPDEFSHIFLRRKERDLDTLLALLCLHSDLLRMQSNFFGIFQNKMFNHCYFEVSFSTLSLIFAPTPFQ